MMDVAGLRECIGTKRFVWIDDDFNDTPKRLANMLVGSPEVTRRCGFGDIDDLFEGIEADEQAVRDDVVDHLSRIGDEGLRGVKARFFAERVAMNLSGPEFDQAVVEAVCRTLEIQAGDRHPFDEGIEAVKALCNGEDDDIGYIVDLNDATAEDRRGLEILRILAESNSKGIAFILTHDADQNGEAEKEEELGRDLIQGCGGATELNVPVCVIAKERLFDKVDDAAVQEPLLVALKRAGLRRCMHQVLGRARETVHAEFARAASSLLSVPPEALDAFVVERGYHEGMSELHVVERALAAHVSMSLKRLFGTDAEVRARADVMRRLREVTLNGVGPRTDVRLEAFRQAEIWEADELINAGYAPIACGDVFESDMAELPETARKRRFLLLGQPCDISIRPDGKRDQEAAFLVPMTERSADEVASDKPKTSSFPFAIDNQVWTCNLRNTTMARLAVLDLASFRPDGTVRVDDGHQPPAGLLPGQQKVYSERTKAADRAIAAPSQGKTAKSQGAAPIDPDLQLTLSRDDDYKSVHIGHLVAAQHTLPKRVTWRMRRIGRVQMPYAAAMLETLTGSMSRRAFDLDFARARPTPPIPKPVASTSVEIETDATAGRSEGLG